MSHMTEGNTTSVDLELDVGDMSLELGSEEDEKRNDYDEERYEEFSQKLWHIIINKTEGITSNTITHYKNDTQSATNNYQHSA